MPQFIRLSLAALLGSATLACADPLDTTARNTFHLSVIGAFDERPFTLNAVTEYKGRMLALTGGEMPSNLKVSVNAGLDFMWTTFGGYYDYIYAPGGLETLPTHKLGQVEYHARLCFDHDIGYGVGVNGMPWGDSYTQSEDILHNYLEQYEGGSLLQVDRYGRIRNASLPQDPTIDEQFSGAAQLEMQVTLSRYADVVRDYARRNCRMGMRQLAFVRDQHPDLVFFASMSSEVGQGLHANVEYTDYSTWSKAEFRDWLSGAGVYAGQGQFTSLAAFNATYAGALGFPWTSWSLVDPPINDIWDNTPDGRWWQKWQEFRIAQVQHFVQDQVNWCIDAGWSPDMLYGHQVPQEPTDTHHLSRKTASPYTTTFVDNAGNGITTYGPDTLNTPVFDDLYANDRNWGIFEYNPLDTDSVAANLFALETAWDAGARILSPYLWWGFTDYQIRDRPLQTAMAQFLANHRYDIYNELARHEVSPVMNDVIWSMSETNHVEANAGLSDMVVINGTARAVIDGPEPRFELEFNEGPDRVLLSDRYYAASCRLHLGTGASGLARIVWRDEDGDEGAIPFYVKEGWNQCRILLSEHAAWRERRITSVELRLPPSSGTAVILDWFRLEAAPCWHFDDPDEVYAINHLTNPSVGGGTISGISGLDTYFYLSTDKRDPLVDADRAWIDADQFKKVRVRMTASVAAIAEIFWWKRGSSFHQTTFNVIPGTHTYEVDLSSHPDWHGQVTRFRLDPVNMPDIALEVEYINVSPILLPPQAANADPIVNSPTPVFLWHLPTHPDHPGITYRLELVTDFESTNVVFSRTGLTSGRLVYSEDMPLDGLYWWRIRSEDAAGPVSPWSVPMPLFVRPWTFDRLEDGARSNHLTGATVNSGVWQATTTGSDPYLHLNTGGHQSRDIPYTHQLTRGINADIYTRFRMRVKQGFSFFDAGQFFFFSTDGGFSSVNFSWPAYGQWHEIELDLADNPDWNGYIHDLRIDPLNVSDLEVAIDYAYVLPPEEGPPELHLQYDGEQLILTWDAADAVLETTEDVGGSWTPLPHAASPYILPPPWPTQFFRLRQP